MIYALILGFLMGVRHAFDADHLAAVATLVVRNASPRESARVGLAWGAGHALMLLGASLVVLWLGVASRRFEPLLEGAVGVMLIALGVDLVRRMQRGELHFHGHRHDGKDLHYHFHVHAPASDHAPDSHQHSHGTPGALRAMLVGLVHGLAGSAALLVLAMASSPSAGAALAYVAVFGLGSMLGMAAISLTVAWPLRFCAGRPRLLAALTGLAGCASLLLGGLLLAEMVLAPPGA